MQKDAEPDDIDYEALCREIKEQIEWDRKYWFDDKENTEQEGVKGNDT